MSRKPRDYKAEYARRIARGLARGLSRSQARGHPRSKEKPIRKVAKAKPAKVDRRLEDAVAYLRKGRSLTASAKHAHVSPERLRRHLSSLRFVSQKRGRWVIGTDTRRRRMLLYSRGRDVEVTVSAAEAAKIGRFMAAVSQFLDTNDASLLAPFAGQSVVDAKGKRHPFETDPNVLYRLADTGGSAFEDVYRIVA